MVYGELVFETFSSDRRVRSPVGLGLLNTANAH